MALNYVTLIVDLYTAAGQPFNYGTATFTPTVPLVDTVNHEIIAQTPVASFGITGLAQITLLATDNPTLQPTGWAWTVTFSQAQAPQSFSFFLPYSAGATQYLSSQSPVFTPPVTTAFLPVPSGGTPGAGQVPVATGAGPTATAWGTVSRFVNPMTTLGDLIAGGAGGTAIRLPGNTAASRQFLRSQGAGGAATASVWDTLQPGDLPPQPWQFKPETYNAKGDGKVLGDVVTNSTTTITSASANFSAADVGKYIMIHGANGATSTPLITTISSVTNATTVVLASAAGASVSNCPAVYGTDDTAAINSAVTAAGSYALANTYFAEIVFSAKIYILAAGPTQTGNGSSLPTFNSQIPLPYPNVNGSTQKLIISLVGPGDAGYCQYWMSLVPNIAGAALVSMQTPPQTVDPTFGVQSVIGGPSVSGPFVGGFVNMKVAVKGLSVWCPIWTNSYAYDFGYLSQARVQQSSAHIFAPTGTNGGVQPYLNGISSTNFKNSHGHGFRMPVNENNDDIVMDDVTVEGYEVAFQIADHFVAGRIAALFSDVVLRWDSSQGSGTSSHIISIQSISAEAYNGGLLGSGDTVHFDINWDSETTVPVFDFSLGSGSRGIIRFRDPLNVRFPVVSNLGGVSIICEELGPGVWASPPAVPASGTPLAASASPWRNAWVNIQPGAGGTISAIAIDGTTLTGITSGAIRVPSGHLPKITWATTVPTWQWILD